MLVYFFLYLIGSDKLSTELHTLSEEINKKYTNINIDYKYNDENDPNRFYYRSDHYNFAEKNIPIIFYFSGTHEDYHKPTDTVDKIEFDLLQQRTQLIFHHHSCQHDLDVLLLLCIPREIHFL